MTEDEFIPKEIIDLIHVLIAQTQTRDLQWQEGSHPTEFVLLRPEGSVVIESRDRDGQQPFIFRVIDDEGIEVESYYGEEAFGGLLEELYVAARRTTVVASSTTKKLLESLRPDELPF